jgi:prepilin-type N-terminal cleavage/methylation domain-containing protein
MIIIYKKQAGFTLVELSIVLIVVGLLLGTTISALTSFLSRAQFSQTEAQLALVQEALIGYVISRGRLPCPDRTDYPPVAPTFGSGSDGLGDIAGVTCAGQIGYLPYAELGLPGRDTWDTLYYYRVDDVYADNPSAGQTVTFTLSEAEGNIEVKNKKDPPGDMVIADNIVALVFSAGPNAHISLAEASDDEDENLNGDATFVDKNYVPEGAAEPEFDDVSRWISSYVLKAKMAEAQRLPE